MMQRYGEVNPRYPDMIMDMAHKETEALIVDRRTTVQAEGRAVTSAAVGTILIPCMALIFGFILALHGHPIAGSVFAVVPAALVGLAKIVAATKGKGS